MKYRDLRQSWNKKRKVLTITSKKKMMKWKR